MTCPARRTVLKGAAAACGAGLLSACGGGGGGETAQETTAPARSGGTGGDGLRASLGQVDDVPVGGAIATAAPDGTKVLLTRSSDDEDVQAFSAVCPHEGCTVAPDDGQLSCPCHGSQFELNGDLKRGPARTGLTRFPVRVVDGQVLPA